MEGLSISASRTEEKIALLADMARLAMASLRADGIAIAYQSRDSVVCSVCCGNVAPPIGTRLNMNTGITAECMREGGPLQCFDTETDARVNRKACRGIGLRSMLVVPLVRNSEVIGVAEAFYAKPNGFQEGTLQELEQTSHLFVEFIPSENVAASITTATTDSNGSNHGHEESGLVSPSDTLDWEAFSLADVVDESTLRILTDQSANPGVFDPAEFVLENESEEALTPETVSTTSGWSSRVPHVPVTGQPRFEEARIPRFSMVPESHFGIPKVVAACAMVICALLWATGHIYTSAQRLASDREEQTASPIPVKEQVFSSASHQPKKGSEKPAVESPSPIAELMKKAESGDPRAQILLAQHYENGYWGSQKSFEGLFVVHSGKHIG